MKRISLWLHTSGYSSGSAKLLTSIYNILFMPLVQQLDANCGRREQSQVHNENCVNKPDRLAVSSPVNQFNMFRINWNAE